MFDEKLSAIYYRYFSELKPLIAEYESRNENFVAPLLVDLPIMFDCIALFNIDRANKDAHLEEANNSLNKAICILKRYITADIMEDVNLFKSRNPKQLLLTLDNGRFYGKFKGLEDEVRLVKGNKNEVEKTYSLLKKMRAMISECKMELLTKRHLFDNTTTTILKWILTVLIGFIANYIILISFR